MRILVIEDEHKLAKAIANVLRQENYAVDISSDGNEGYSMASSEPYDALIVDRMLPGKNGIDIVKSLRAANNKTPILILTALGTTEDKIFGLDSGADDYLTKPFAIAELLARLRALLRRPKQSISTLLQVSDLKLDTTSKLVTRNDKPINLTAKEYALLEYLMRNNGQIISKDKIIAHVWDFDATILPNNVEAFVKILRQKIDKPFKKSLIKTVRGFGYKMES